MGLNRRNALVKSARLMLEFQTTGAVAWRMMSPDPDLTLSESSRVVLKQFAAAASLELAPGSVRLLAGEIRQFLAYLDRTGRGALGTVTADDVRGFMVEVAPKRSAGVGKPGVVAEEDLRLPQRRRAQRRPHRWPARACRAAAGGGAAVLFPPRGQPARCAHRD